MDVEFVEILPGMNRRQQFGKTVMPGGRPVELLNLFFKVIGMPMLLGRMFELRDVNQFRLFAGRDFARTGIFQKRKRVKPFFVQFASLNYFGQYFSHDLF
ncbi:hypothetical protein D3C87_1393110 [compost metagenome]